MRIEKINEEKIYTFNMEMKVYEIWELYCVLDTHPYVEVAERFQEVLDLAVPELAEFKKEE